jgi:hypothetical protein
MPFGKVLGVIIHPWTKMSRKFLTCLIKRFLVDLYSTSYGAVVHSGERLICIQEVAGSNPTGSTTQLNSNQAFFQNVLHKILLDLC